MDIRFFTNVGRPDAPPMDVETFMGELARGVAFKFTVLMPKESAAPVVIAFAPITGEYSYEFKASHKMIWKHAEGLRLSQNESDLPSRSYQFIPAGGGYAKMRSKDQSIFLYGDSFDFGEFDRAIAARDLLFTIIKVLGYDKVQCRPELDKLPDYVAPRKRGLLTRLLTMLRQ